MSPKEFAFVYRKGEDEEGGKFKRKPRVFENGQCYLAHTD